MPKSSSVASKRLKPSPFPGLWGTPQRKVLAEVGELLKKSDSSLGRFSPPVSSKVRRATRKVNNANARASLMLNNPDMVTSLGKRRK